MFLAGRHADGPGEGTGSGAARPRRVRCATPASSLSWSKASRLCARRPGS